jgi:hypothetical protein
MEGYATAIAIPGVVVGGGIKLVYHFHATYTKRYMHDYVGAL